jgi:hypothetical protein
MSRKPQLGGFAAKLGFQFAANIPACRIDKQE